MNLSNSTGDGDETQRPNEFYRTDGSNVPFSVTWQGRLQTTILDIRSSLVFCELLQRTVDEVHQLLFGTCELSCVRIYAGDGPQRSQLLAESQAFAGDVGVDPLLTLPDGRWDQQIPAPTDLFILDNLFNAVSAQASPAPDPGTTKSLALPMIISNQLWGILMVQQGSGDRPWQSFEIEGLQLLGCHISQAIGQSLQWEARKAIETQDDPRDSPKSGADQQHLVQETLTAQKIQETIEEQSAILRSFYNSCPLWMGVEEVVGDEITMISYNHASLAVLFDELSSESGVPRPLDFTDIRPSSDIAELWLDRYHQAQAEQHPIQFEYHYTTAQKTHWFLATVSFLGVSCYDHPRFSYVVEDISDRKHDELELKRLKEQLELVVEAASEGFWEINYLTGEYYYSSHWKEMLGYTDHELENSEQTWKRIIVPEDLNTVWQQLEAYRNGETNDFVATVRLRHKNGSIRHIYARAIAVQDTSGQVTRIVGSNLDITNLKETEIALQESETNYRRIVENSQEGIWVIDGEGKITFVNPRLLDMLGYLEHDIIGQSCLKFMDLEDERSGINYLQDRKQGLPENHIAKLIKQDGTVLWSKISVTANHDAQGRICGATALLTDMTKILEYQEALKLSQMQLRGILDSSLDGIMAFRSIRDAQGTIIDFEWLLSNPSACEMVRRPKENLIGKRLLVEMPGNWEEGLFYDYVKVVESGIPDTKQFYYHHENVKAWFETISVKLGDGFAVTFRDITKLKKSEQDLHQLNQELAERLQDLEQRNQEMKLLNEISDFLQACLTVEEACLAISSFIKPLFPNCSGAIFMINNSRSQVHAIATWGDELESLTEFSPEDCWSVRRGTIHRITPTTQGLKCQHIHSHRTDLSSVCIPMIAQGETLGLLYLNGNQGCAIPTVSQQLARTVAEQVSMAIANLQLRETLQQQSIRDPLTGLFNRRYLDEFFDQELQRATRNNHPIGVVMLDIDHFKQFNDTYGHDAGDFVLQQVGQLLSRAVRGSDIACRYGGEEMTLLLPESSLESTAHRAEQLCQSIRNLRLTYQGQPLPSVTSSLGVAAFPAQGQTRATLLRVADAALYRAKAGGRNQVVVA